MRLYHGSNQKILTIDLSKSKSHKDFGKGFYLTPDYTRAVSMANRTTELESQGVPEITPYLFNLSKSKQMVNVLEFKIRSAKWALFVLNNRFKHWDEPFSHNYDIVIGPVADSRVDPILTEYMEKHRQDYDDDQNLQSLAARLKFPGEEYIQYCFCTEAGINQLILDL